MEENRCMFDSFELSEHRYKTCRYC